MSYQNNHMEKNMEAGDVEQFLDFIHAIKTDNSPISNLESSVTASKLALAAQRSIDTGMIEKI